MLTLEEQLPQSGMIPPGARAQRLLQLLEKYGIADNGDWEFGGKQPTEFYVVDHNTADPSVGYPGELHAVCPTCAEAQLWRMHLVLLEMDKVTD